MPTQDEQDYKDYLEYQEYLKSTKQTDQQTKDLKQPELPEEPGLEHGSFHNPLAGGIAELLGFDREAAAKNFANKAVQGYGPEIVGGIKSLAGNDYVTARDEAAKTLENLQKRSPISSGLGSISGAMTGGMALNAALPGSTLGRAALQGAAQGATYNPGRTEGVVDPLQLGDRALNAGLGAGVGAAGYGIGKLLGKGKEVSEDVKKIKEGDTSEEVKNEIKKAIESINEKQIAPRADQVREAIKGQKFDINPERVKDTFPNLAKVMSKNLQEGEIRRPLSPERALRLKRAADLAADWSASRSALDPAAKAGEESAESLANILRRQINEIPEAAQANKEMTDILSKRRELFRAVGNRPIAAVQSQPGTDKGDLIKSIDKLAGSNLEGLGERIGTARELLLHPSRLSKPMMIPDELRKATVRVASEAATPLAKAPAGTRESLLNILLGAKQK